MTHEDCTLARVRPCRRRRRRLLDSNAGARKNIRRPIRIGGTSVWPRWRAGLISAGFDLDELVLVEDKAL